MATLCSFVTVYVTMNMNNTGRDNVRKYGSKRVAYESFDVDFAVSDDSVVDV